MSFAGIVWGVLSGVAVAALARFAYVNGADDQARKDEKRIADAEEREQQALDVVEQLKAHIGHIEDATPPQVREHVAKHLRVLYGGGEGDGAAGDGPRAA